MVHFRLMSMLLGILTLQFFSTICRAQDVLWAHEVIDVSSEFASVEFSAEKALGAPDVIAIGDNKGNAWRPKEIGGESFILVSFSDKIAINQIAIMETENPGAIRSILAYEADMTEHVIYQGNPELVPVETRFFHHTFEVTDYEVQFIRVNVDGLSIPGYYGIDAIGISNSILPIPSTIKTSNTLQSNFRLQKLSQAINTQYNELGPLLSLDGNRIYFSRQFSPQNMGGTKDPEDIWYTEWDDQLQEWKPALNMGAPWNNDGPNFICAIAEVDGREVFLLGNRYGKKKMLGDGVSMAEIVKGVGTQPKALKIGRYYNKSEKVDFFLVGNGKILLISSDRDDGLGNRDILVSFLNEKKGKWSEPRNLGPQINTVKEEESPFMSEDATTLYFSSNGYVGYGGLDTYKSTRLDESWTNWSVPENLGKKINGTGDERYLSLSKDSHVFYTRRSLGSNSDIFDVKLAPNDVHVIGRVLEAKSNLPLGSVEVVMVNEEQNRRTIFTNSDGIFEFDLSANSHWKIAAYKSPYLPKEGIDLLLTEEVNLTLSPIYLSDEKFNEEMALAQTQKVFAEKLQAGKEGNIIVLDRIYYNFNSSYLREESKIQLNELAEHLRNNPTVKIQLSAHTDSNGEATYNQWMSERRAQRVRDYLLTQGISADRIAAQGYGESQLLNNCKDDVTCSDAMHQQNRRTEIQLQ